MKQQKNKITMFLVNRIGAVYNNNYDTIKPNCNFA